jgi:chromosomal replication initiation ATPase DnaA
VRLSYITEADLIAAQSITPTPRVRRIVAEVALITGIPEEKILSKDISRAVARARDIAVFIADREGISSGAIGRAIGRDHSSILTGIAREKARRGE